jgi:hypothetical protein
LEVPQQVSHSHDGLSHQSSSNPCVSSFKVFTLRLFWAKRSFQQGTNNRFLCQLQVPQHFVSNTNCDHCTCAIHSNSTCFNRTQSVPVWVNLQRHLELKVLRTWGDTFPSSRPATLLSACALLLLDLVVSLAWKAGKGEEVYTAQTCLHWNKVPTQ